MGELGGKDVEKIGLESVKPRIFYGTRLNEWGRAGQPPVNNEKGKRGGGCFGENLWETRQVGGSKGLF